MKDKHLTKFLKIVSNELKTVKPIAEEIKVEKFHEETTAERIANYLSTSQKRDDSIPNKNADLIQKSTASDKIPAAPENIEQQRWNDPLRPLDQKFVTFKEMNDHYSLFLNRIQQQMASLGGGGEVLFARLDDVNANSASENKFLTYDAVTKKYRFEFLPVGAGLQLSENPGIISTKTSSSFGYETDGTMIINPASENIIGGIKLGPGTILNPFNQLIIDSEGLDFSFGDFFAYTAEGPTGETAAYLSSINDNEDIVISSNGTGSINFIGGVSIYTTESAGDITTAIPVFSVNDAGDIAATTLNIVNNNDLGFRAPLNVSINEQGLTKTPAVIGGSVAQFTGRDNLSPLLVIDSYGTDTTGAISQTGGGLVFRTGKGTNETPAIVETGDRLGEITAAGWASNGYGGVAVAAYKILANEPFTPTARGSRLELSVTPNGTIVPETIVTVDGNCVKIAEHKTLIVDEIGPIQQLSFDITHDTSSHVHVPGDVCWNADDRTLNVFQPDGVTLQVGQESFILARNMTGSTITDGTCVRFSGASINGEARIEATPFLANGTFPSLYTLGIATHDILNGNAGMITVFGKVRELDTTGTAVGESWQVGDILYANPNFPGGLTRVKPTAPNNVVPVAAVLLVDDTLGEIFVRPTIEQKKSYGKFARTTDLAIATINTAFVIPLNLTEVANGVELDTENPSRIKVDQSGLYQIDISAQIDLSGGGFSSATMYLWLRKNGVDVPDSTRRQGVLGSAPSANIGFSVVISLNTNDYIEIGYAGSSTDLSFDSANATAFAPSTTAVKVGVAQIQL